MRNGFHFVSSYPTCYSAIVLLALCATVIFNQFLGVTQHFRRFGYNYEIASPHAGSRAFIVLSCLFQIGELKAELRHCYGYESHDYCVWHAFIIIHIFGILWPKSLNGGILDSIVAAWIQSSGKPHIMPFHPKGKWRKCHTMSFQR